MLSRKARELHELPAKRLMTGIEKELLFRIQLAIYLTEKSTHKKQNKGARRWQKTII